MKDSTSIIMSFDNTVEKIDYKLELEGLYNELESLSNSNQSEMDESECYNSKLKYWMDLVELLRKYNEDMLTLSCNHFSKLHEEKDNKIKTLVSEIHAKDKQLAYYQSTNMILNEKLNKSTSMLLNVTKLLLKTQEEYFNVRKTICSILKKEKDINNALNVPMLSQIVLDKINLTTHFTPEKFISSVDKITSRLPRKKQLIKSFSIDTKLTEYGHLCFLMENKRKQYNEIIELIGKIVEGDNIDDCNLKLDTTNEKELSKALETIEYLKDEIDKQKKLNAQLLEQKEFYKLKATAESCHTPSSSSETVRELEIIKKNISNMQMKLVKCGEKMSPKRLEKIKKIKKLTTKRHSKNNSVEENNGDSCIVIV